MANIHGITFCANLPTEETFTAPDPTRVDGVVTASKPLMIPARLRSRASRCGSRAGGPCRSTPIGAEILRG